MDRTPPETPVARYIRQRRQTAGLTQADLAARVGCTQAAVSQWELGGRIPVVQFLPALARALDVPVGELMDRIADPDPYRDDDTNGERVLA